MPADAPRLLHAHSQYGYTSNPSRALFAEGEAVPADYQRGLTASAVRTARELQAAEWREHRDEIRRRLDWVYSQRLQRDVNSQLRALDRQLERLDRRIGL